MLHIHFAMSKPGEELLIHCIIFIHYIYIYMYIHTLHMHIHYYYSLHIYSSLPFINHNETNGFWWHIWACLNGAVQAYTILKSNALWVWSVQLPAERRQRQEFDQSLNQTNLNTLNVMLRIKPVVLSQFQVTKWTRCFTDRVQFCEARKTLT